MSDKPGTFLELIENMTPAVHAKLKTAVELGRWPGGERLSGEQSALCLQAIIVYEARHLPAAERTGFVERRACASRGQSAEGEKGAT